MRRKLKFLQGEYYHVYTRGTDKRIIFFDQDDYERCLILLYVCNSYKTFHISNSRRAGRIKLFNVERGDTIVDICAFCLMPNHLHILVHEKQDNGIVLFMQKFLTAYSMYFNRKYKRTGVLFESRYKASHADTDEYLKYLFSYVHLNPVKLIQPDWKESGIDDLERAKVFVVEYSYSSIGAYTSSNKMAMKIVNTKAAPNFFVSNSVKDQMVEWLNYRYNM